MFRKSVRFIGAETDDFFEFPIVGLGRKWPFGSDCEGEDWDCVLGVGRMEGPNLKVWAFGPIAYVRKWRMEGAKCNDVSAY